MAINATRTLLLLDGTKSSMDKAKQLDGGQGTAQERLRQLLGPDLGYVLCGDNMMKMMMALYRIRCGLPVVIFGESGVGKSALFRFLETLLGHRFDVCNVHSSTSVGDVERAVANALHFQTSNQINDQPCQLFLFFDEMNTADPPVIAFIKELMLERHFYGARLPVNLHLMTAANP